ncbi:hypothetical protein NDU88_000870 [Pleurodeles waltl]|uniref:Uncharacterized protein n=1 Tax=Pleurodeles waltl TaxID=8319 RepID=A0AAV7WGR1_PLEWA|nr:hypothetical protein NDU88_000870 [Pleurodeles waltl]
MPEPAPTQSRPMTFSESVGRKVMEPPLVGTSTMSDDAEKESADVKKDPSSPEEDSCQGIPSAPNHQPLKCRRAL